MSEIAQWLESEEFYELMQAYRHAPRFSDGLGPISQGKVIAAFEAVKAAILEKSASGDAS